MKIKESYNGTKSVTSEDHSYQKCNLYILREFIYDHGRLSGKYSLFFETKTSFSK